MPPLSHSLTSWRPAGTLRMWLVAEGETQATMEAAVTGSTLVQGAWEQVRQSAIDLCGLEGPCQWGHLPQLTDYYRLCWDLGLEKTPSTITLYGRDISNKIPISSERERKREEKDRKVFGKLSAMGGNLISFIPFLFFLTSFLHSNFPLILELHKWDLQNRLTPFISSVCHYPRVSFEARLCFSAIYGCMHCTETENGHYNDLRFLPSRLMGETNHQGPSPNCTHTASNSQSARRAHSVSQIQQKEMRILCQAWLST